MNMQIQTYTSNMNMQIKLYANDKNIQMKLYAKIKPLILMWCMYTNVVNPFELCTKN